MDELLSLPSDASSLSPLFVVVCLRNADSTRTAVHPVLLGILCCIQPIVFFYSRKQAVFIVRVRVEVCNSL